MRGTVKRVFQDKGFGFIKGEDGIERFFHKQSCNLDFSRLQEGDSVQFEEEESSKGPRATDIELV